MERVSSSRTRIERDFNPDQISMMKETSVRDLSVGGPNIAAQAIRAGLVDAYHFFVTPILVGAGKPSLPEKVRFKLKLLDECRFDNGDCSLNTWYIPQNRTRFCRNLKEETRFRCL
jgi:dihydrofolate reductase